MAKIAEDSTKEDFRDRSRREYEERRAENRLGMDIVQYRPLPNCFSDLCKHIGPAQRTCATLDEKSGIPVSHIYLHIPFPLADYN